MQTAAQPGIHSSTIVICWQSHVLLFLLAFVAYPVRRTPCHQARDPHSRAEKRKCPPLETAFPLADTKRGRSEDNLESVLHRPTGLCAIPTSRGTPNRGGQ